MNCSKCSGTGTYHTEEWAGVKVHPCSCKQSMTVRQAQEQQFKNFLERLNLNYERSFGKSAPSYVEYQRKQEHRTDGRVLLTE
jgi:hypothetical protein